MPNVKKIQSGGYTGYISTNWTVLDCAGPSNGNNQLSGYLCTSRWNNWGTVQPRVLRKDSLEL